LGYTDHIRLLNNLLGQAEELDAEREEGKSFIYDEVLEIYFN